MSDPASPGIRTLAELAPGLEIVRESLDADATRDPDLVDAWKQLDATAHMQRLLGYVDALVGMPEEAVTIGDVREVTAAIVATGLMVLTLLPKVIPLGRTEPPAEPPRIHRVH